MNFDKTSQSYDPSEALPQERAVKESYTSCENCSCDTANVCDSCSTQNSEIKEITSDRKLPMCRRRNQKKNKANDSEENQNCDKDFHSSGKHTNNSTAEQCLSGENTLSKQNGEIEDCKSDSTIFSKDCNTEESTETTSPENCEHSNIVDSRRTRRNSKRKRDVEDFCPVCGITVRYSELASHYAKEVENLSKISKSIKKIRSEEHPGVNTTFVQVKSNRENRHAAKVAQFSTRPKNEVSCPVCSMKLTGPQDVINTHVLNCINEGEDYEDIIIVDDDEDSFEEYEFADQTRIRAISMVPGGYKSLQGDSSKPRCDNDDEDLNVDVDDTLAYDVIHTPADDTDNEGLEQLRKAVLVDPSAERHVLLSRKWGNNGDGSANCEDSSSTLDKSKSEANHNSKASEQEFEIAENLKSCKKEAENHVVSSLKEKIKDLEEQNKSVKCLICLEPYTKPVVSTTCWHVHCEECWLMTMGVKKLCPQCNIIVFPSDLRRIYL